MLADLAAIPGAGSLAATGLLYAGLSLFVTGPLVAERTIDKSGWPQSCARQMRSAATQPPADTMPGLGCGSLLGSLYGRDGLDFCARPGEALGFPFDLLGGVLGQTLETARQRATERASRAGSACVCAVGTVLDERRVEFALYAGTARLVTPRPVRNLRIELDRAVSSPICRAGD